MQAIFTALTLRQSLIKTLFSCHKSLANTHSCVTVTSRHTPFSGNPPCAWGAGVSHQPQTSSACMSVSRSRQTNEPRTRPQLWRSLSVNVNGARCGSRENDKQMRSEGRYAHVSRLISARSSHRCGPARERNISKLKHDHRGIQGRFNVQT